jgi:hypothetical protein
MSCTFCGAGSADERPFWCYKQDELKPGVGVVTLHEFNLSMCDACVIAQSQQLRELRRQQRRAIFKYVWPIFTPIVILIAFFFMRIASPDEALLSVIGRACLLGALISTGFILLLAMCLTVTMSKTVVNRELWPYAAQKQPGLEGFKGFWFEKPTHIRIKGPFEA